MILFPIRFDAAACAALLLTLPTVARAVDPFVVDDTWIAAPGQIETESWFEVATEEGTFVPALNLIVNFGLFEWLELSVGGGVGWEPDDEQLSVANPELSTKLLLLRAVDGKVPGLALTGGVAAPWGAGVEDVVTAFVIVPATWVTGGGGVAVHANLGWVAARPRGGEGRVDRFFWGLATAVGLGVADLEWVGEAFAGDPGDPLGPDFGWQTGFRWAPEGRALEVDLALGGDREGEWVGQLGLRMIFDTFTGGRPRDPEGGKGLFGP